MRALLSESTAKLSHTPPGWRAAVVYLSPARSVGPVEVEGSAIPGLLAWPKMERERRVDLCPSRSDGCTASCLVSAGRLRFDPARDARRARTLLFLRDPAEYVSRLVGEVERFAARAAKGGERAAVRLNGTSDVAWEDVPEAAALWSLPVVWYDYTKRAARAWAFARGDFPSSYHLCFSRSEENEAEAWELLQAGVSVTVACSRERKAAWLAAGDEYGEDFPLVDGDAHDLRFLDEPGSRVLLGAKGRARRDTTGFVVREDSELFAPEPADSAGLRRRGRPRLWPAGWVVVAVRLPVDVVAWWRGVAERDSSPARRLTSAAVMGAELVRVARGAGASAVDVVEPGDLVRVWWDPHRLRWVWSRDAAGESGELGPEFDADSVAGALVEGVRHCLGEACLLVVVERGK